MLWYGCKVVLNLTRLLSAYHLALMSQILANSLLHTFGEGKQMHIYTTGYTMHIICRTSLGQFWQFASVCSDCIIISDLRIDQAGFSKTAILPLSTSSQRGLISIVNFSQLGLAPTQSVGRLVVGHPSVVCRRSYDDAGSSICGSDGGASPRCSSSGVPGSSPGHRFHGCALYDCMTSVTGALAAFDMHPSLPLLLYCLFSRCQDAVNWPVWAITSRHRVVSNVQQGNHVAVANMAAVYGNTCGPYQLSSCVQLSLSCSACRLLLCVVSWHRTFSACCSYWEPLLHQQYDMFSHDSPYLASCCISGFALRSYDDHCSCCEMIGAAGGWRIVASSRRSTLGRIVCCGVSEVTALPCPAGDPVRDQALQLLCKALSTRESPRHAAAQLEVALYREYGGGGAGEQLNVLPHPFLLPPACAVQGLSPEAWRQYCLSMPTNGRIVGITSRAVLRIAILLLPYVSQYRPSDLKSPDIES